MELPHAPEEDRRLTRCAAPCASALDSADRLSDFAAGRAHPNAIYTTRVLAGEPSEPRCFRREALEELADCRNYLCWEIRRRARLRIENLEVHSALIAVVAAWVAVERIGVGE